MASGSKQCKPALARVNALLLRRNFSRRCGVVAVRQQKFEPMSDVSLQKKPPPG
jgi:hypothetical protein